MVEGYAHSQKVFVLHMTGIGKGLASRQIGNTAHCFAVHACIKYSFSNRQLFLDIVGVMETSGNKLEVATFSEKIGGDNQRAG